MKEEILLIGGGGHCRSCIDVIETQNKYQIAGIIDIEEKLHSKILNYEIIATDEDLINLIKEYKYFFITIGHIKTYIRRLELFDFLYKNGATIPSIISPFSYVSKHTKISDGSIIMHNVVINSNVEIGVNCIINTGVIIEHDSIIENHCHISTGVIINGGCIVRNKSFIGSNSSLIEGVTVGEDIIVGAGSLITESVETSGIYFGSPAKFIKGISNV